MPPDAPVVAPAPAPVAPAAAPAAVAAPAAPGAEAPKPDGNILADAGKGTTPAAPTKDEQTAFLATKGMKPEDVAKLDDAGLKAKFDELKAADAKPKEVTVADIEVKLPDGATVDQEALDAFKGIIADAKLSPSERAQKLIDMHASIVQRTQQANSDLWFKTQADWQKEVKSDKELGGENFDKVRATIAKALGQFGGEYEPKIREAFELTGAGNHPALVRVFYRMAQALVEGGGIPGTAPNPVANAAALLYPSNSK